MLTMMLLYAGNKQKSRSANPFVSARSALMQVRAKVVLGAYIARRNTSSMRSRSFPVPFEDTGDHDTPFENSFLSHQVLDCALKDETDEGSYSCCNQHRRAHMRFANS